MFDQIERIDTNISPEVHEPLTPADQYRIPGSWILDKVGQSLNEKEGHGYVTPVVDMQIEHVQKLDGKTRNIFRDHIQYMTQTKQLMDKYDRYLAKGLQDNIKTKDLLPRPAYTWKTANTLAFRRALVYLTENNRPIKGKTDIPYIISLIRIQHKAWIEAGRPLPAPDDTTLISTQHDIDETRITEHTTRQLTPANNPGNLGQVDTPQDNIIVDSQDTAVGIVRQAVEYVQGATGQTISGDITIHNTEDDLSAQDPDSGSDTGTEEQPVPNTPSAIQPAPPQPNQNATVVNQNNLEQAQERGVTFADEAQRTVDGSDITNHTGMIEHGATEQGATMQHDLANPLRNAQNSAPVSQTTQRSESELFQTPIGLIHVDPIQPMRAELPTENWPPQHPTAQLNFRTEAPWPIRTSTPNLAGQGLAVGNPERGRVDTLANIAAKANPLHDATNRQVYDQQLLATPLRTTSQREDDRRVQGGAIPKRNLLQPVAKAALISNLLYPQNLGQVQGNKVKDDDIFGNLGPKLKHNIQPQARPQHHIADINTCLLYTSPSPRD